MYRNSLPVLGGMLFVYPSEAKRSFWMKNTYIPLDIIFMDKNFTVQGICANAPPRTFTPQQVPDAKSMYVLELMGGQTQTLGIKAGDSLRIDGQLPEAEEGA